MLHEEVFSIETNGHILRWRVSQNSSTDIVDSLLNAATLAISDFSEQPWILIIDMQGMDCLTNQTIAEYQELVKWSIENGAISHYVVTLHQAFKFAFEEIFDDVRMLEFIDSSELDKLLANSSQSFSLREPVKLFTGSFHNIC